MQQGACSHVTIPRIDLLELDSRVGTGCYADIATQVCNVTNHDGNATHTGSKDM